MEEFILKQKEFKDGLVMLINNSNLPMCTVRPILVDILNQVSMFEEQEYQNAVKNKEMKETAQGESIQEETVQKEAETINEVKTDDCKESEDIEGV